MTASTEVLNSKNTLIGTSIASMVAAFPEGVSQRKATLRTLLKITQNALQDPNNPKFKSIRLSNKRFQRVVASQKYAVDVLLACGWMKSADGLRLTLVRFDSALLWMCKSQLEQYI